MKVEHNAQYNLPSLAKRITTSVKNNVSVLRLAQRGQKSLVEQRGKWWLDPDVHYA